MELDAEEARVVGSLIEKQLTTPQQYPLTMGSLVAACNQSTNRSPVVGYEDATVHGALSRLKQAGLVRFVHPSHGRSVIRFRQVLEEVLTLEREELSLLGALLLRGPQTAAELRARTERMAELGGLEDVERRLGRLADRPDPLVARLGRQPGQKEARYAQLLSSGATGGGAPPPALEVAHLGATGTRADGEEVSGALSLLAQEVSDLRAEVAVLRRELDDLRAALGA
ncbi:MAG: DUF480 domain-containing protein [Acidimicrobiales bacterium]